MNINRAKTRSELAMEYGVSRRTFYSWLKKENIKLPNGLLLPVHVKTVYEKFGYPLANISQNYPDLPNKHYS